MTHRWAALPNGITAVRLLLALPLGWLVAVGHARAALLLVALAALTDWLDGYLARAWGVASRVGALLDPAADKLLLSAVYIGFWQADPDLWWLPLLVLGRDLLIVIGAGLVWLVTRRRDFPPSPWGKLSTTFQLALAAAILVRQTGGLSSALELFLLPLLPAMVAATVFSGLQYAWRGVGMLIDGRSKRGVG